MFPRCGRGLLEPNDITGDSDVNAFFHSVPAWAVAAALFVLTFVFTELGYWLGGRAAAKAGNASEAPVGALLGAMFGLLGLLLAFTFSIAAGRFAQRVELLRDEANAYSTAFLRTELLDESVRPGVQALLRQYGELRKQYDAEHSLSGAVLVFKQGEPVAGEIWKHCAMAARRDPANPGLVSLLESMNQLFDLAASRMGAFYYRLPFVIFLLLAIVHFFSGILIGYSLGLTGQHRWTVVTLYALAVCMVVFVILDLDDPQAGLLRVWTRPMEYTVDSFSGAGGASKP